MMIVDLVFLVALGLLAAIAWILDAASREAGSTGTHPQPPTGPGGRSTPPSPANAS